MKEDKISVLLCTYNGKEFLEELLDSIINQTRAPDELVIIDDRSNDGTHELIKQKLKYINFKINLILEKNAYNLGVTKNFEYGLSKVNGDVIFLADQDDVWNLNKIRTIEKKFQEDSNVIMIFSNGYIVDESLKRRKLDMWSNMGIDNKNDFIANDMLLSKYCLSGCTMAFRKELIQSAIPIPNSYQHHDAWLGLVAATKGKCIGICQKLISYRQHGKNVVGARRISIRGLVENYNGYLKNTKSELMKLKNIRNSLYRNKSYKYCNFQLFDNRIIFYEIRLKIINERIVLALCAWLNNKYSVHENGFKSKIKDFLFLIYRIISMK